MSIILLVIAFMLAIGSLVIQKSVPSIVSFVLMMFVLGLYYISQDAKLLGLFQIFVYTGGIMVLMLFGVTIIGIEYPKSEIRWWSAFGAFLVFLSLVFIFFKNIDLLEKVDVSMVENVNLFSSDFSDFIIIFALIGSSIIYGSVKMGNVLVAKKGKKDV